MTQLCRIPHPPLIAHDPSVGGGYHFFAPRGSVGDRTHAQGIAQGRKARVGHDRVGRPLVMGPLADRAHGDTRPFAEVLEAPHALGEGPQDAGEFQRGAHGSGHLVAVGLAGLVHLDGVLLARLQPLERQRLRIGHQIADGDRAHAARIDDLALLIQEAPVLRQGALGYVAARLVDVEDVHAQHGGPGVEGEVVGLGAHGDLLGLDDGKLQVALDAAASVRGVDGLLGGGLVGGKPSLPLAVPAHPQAPQHVLVAVGVAGDRVGGHLVLQVWVIPDTKSIGSIEHEHKGSRKKSFRALGCPHESHTHHTEAA